MAAILSSESKSEKKHERGDYMSFTIPSPGQGHAGTCPQQHSYTLTGTQRHVQEVMQLGVSS